MRTRCLVGLTLVAATAGAALVACSDRETTAPRTTMPSMAMNQNAQGGVEKGVTDGWLDGQTVQFFYVKPSRGFLAHRRRTCCFRLIVTSSTSVTEDGGSSRSSE